VFIDFISRDGWQIIQRSYCTTAVWYW